MSRRRKYADKEYDELQKLKHENSRLRKSVRSLRKQISRIDLDRYSNLKNLIDKHLEEEHVDVLEKQLKRQWECYKCGEGFLRLYTIARRDKTVYYRKCTECSNRTPIKPYTDKIEGIKDDE